MGVIWLGRSSGPAPRSARQDHQAFQDRALPGPRQQGLPAPRAPSEGQVQHVLEPSINFRVCCRHPGEFVPHTDQPHNPRYRRMSVVPLQEGGFAFPLKGFGFPFFPFDGFSRSGPALLGGRRPVPRGLRRGVPALGAQRAQPGAAGAFHGGGAEALRAGAPGHGAPGNGGETNELWPNMK